MRRKTQNTKHKTQRAKRNEMKKRNYFLYAEFRRAGAVYSGRILKFESLKARRIYKKEHSHFFFIEGGKRRMSILKVSGETIANFEKMLDRLQSVEKIETKHGSYWTD